MAGTLFTEPQIVEVRLEPVLSVDTGTLPLQDHRVYQTAGALNLRINTLDGLFLLKNLESESPVLQEIPYVPTTDVFDDAIFGTNMGSGNDHSFLEFTGGEWQTIETGEPAWYLTFLAGNRLFARTGGSTEGAYSLSEYRSEGWVPVIDGLPEFHFKDGTTYLDGKGVLVISIPSLEETRYLCESQAGYWTQRSYSFYGDSSRSASGAILFRSEEDQVYVGGAEPFVWLKERLHGYNATEAHHGPWLPLMADGLQDRMLAHVDGRQVLYQPEGLLSPNPDPTGRYLLAFPDFESNVNSLTRLSLYPINEFSLKPGPSAPRMRSAGGKLHLNVSVDVLQMNLGSRVDVPGTLGIYLCKDETPEFEASLLIGETSLPLQLNLLETETLELTAELPESLPAGSYLVGVFLNRGSSQVPESTFENNVVWQEWTLERYAKIEKAPLPSSDRISFTPDAPYPLVGDTISVSFHSKAGFSFSGWGPEIGNTTNPTQIKLPNHLYLSVGEIPDSIGALLPDIEYSGYDFWHSSGNWGWFIGEYFPWVYHLHHGWLFFNPAGQQDAVFYFDAALGWVYFQPQSYPYLYSYTKGRWFYYLKDTASPRWFYDLSAQQWEAI